MTKDQELNAYRHALLEISEVIASEEPEEANHKISAILAQVFGFDIVKADEVGYE